MTKKGFTLLEMLAVIGILGLILLLIVPGIIKIYTDSRINSFVNEAQTIIGTSNNEFISDKYAAERENLFYCYDGEITDWSLDLLGNKNVHYIVSGNSKIALETLICNETICIYQKKEDGLDEADITKELVTKKGEEGYGIVSCKDGQDTNISDLIFKGNRSASIEGDDIIKTIDGKNYSNETRKKSIEYGKDLIFELGLNEEITFDDIFVICDNNQFGEISSNKLIVRSITKDTTCKVRKKGDAEELNFEDQVINKTYSTSKQTINIISPTNGTGNYVFSEVSETRSNGTATNYISLSNSVIEIAAGTPAGTYNYVIRVTDSITGSKKDAMYEIVIGKADATLTVGSVNVTVSANGSKSINYTYVGDGNISCVTGDSSIATCSVSNTSGNGKITINGVTDGSTTITLKASEGTNYKAATDINLSALVSAIPTIADVVATDTYSGTSSVTLTYTMTGEDLIYGIQKYILYYKKSTDDDYSSLTITTSEGTTTTSMPAEPSTTYDYYVVVYNTKGLSTKSTVKNITTKTYYTSNATKCGYSYGSWKLDGSENVSSCSSLNSSSCSTCTKYITCSSTKYTCGSWGSAETYSTSCSGSSGTRPTTCNATSSFITCKTTTHYTYTCKTKGVGTCDSINCCTSKCAGAGGVKTCIQSTLKTTYSRTVKKYKIKTTYTRTSTAKSCWK